MGELVGEAGAELAGGSDIWVGCGCGLADDVGPECPVQWTKTECAGHFGALFTETWVNFPFARHA